MSRYDFDSLYDDERSHDFAELQFEEGFVDTIETEMGFGMSVRALVFMALGYLGMFVGEKHVGAYLSTLGLLSAADGGLAFAYNYAKSKDNPDPVDRMILSMGRGATFAITDFISGLIGGYVKEG